MNYGYIKIVLIGLCCAQAQQSFASADAAQSSATAVVVASAAAQTGAAQTSDDYDLACVLLMADIGSPITAGKQMFPSVDEMTKFPTQQVTANGIRMKELSNNIATINEQLCSFVLTRENNERFRKLNAQRHSLAQQISALKQENQQLVDTWRQACKSRLTKK